MNEEPQIIVSEEKSRDLRSFFSNNKKSLIIFTSIILITLFTYFFYSDYKKNQKFEISEKYNSALITYDKENPSQSVLEMKNIINSKDSTYSPLALYFLLDNNLLKSKKEINQYFNIIINEINLDKEIKNLIIYKKGLYNSNSATEEELLNILNPLINSESIWKSHSLYLMAEYFFSKNEKQKSKEFFEKILEMEESNPQIKIEAQKRLRRDFGV